jgi:hypothetical protein
MKSKDQAFVGCFSLLLILILNAIAGAFCWPYALKMHG